MLFYYYCTKLRPLGDGRGGTRTARGRALAGKSRLLEGLASDGSLLLGLERLGLGTVEDLEQRVDALAHAVVHVRLRALDVVHEVVAEGLDVVDGLIAVLGLEVRLEEHCITVSDEDSRAADSAASYRTRRSPSWRRPSRPSRP